MSKIFMKTVVFGIALSLSGLLTASASAAPKGDPTGPQLTAGGIGALELKKDDPKPPKDKPKKSKKNDGKDGDPDDGNAGKGNDDKTLPNDGPIND